ncbi:phenylalanyl-tRNA synthetase mitochondrial precursor [Xylaria palmicola]|nr:phenylalanyl-tRNA synthetase mitochondrial precursor [Xylaria palmicola]
MWATRFSVACRSARRIAVPASRTWQPCRSGRRFSSEATPAPDAPPQPGPASIEIAGAKCATDSWFNVPPNILDRVPRRLHLQKDNPIYITRQIIESVFPAPTYKYHNGFGPAVTTHQNFDSLGFPENHPGRDKTDTYYINSGTVLRTHTSAHQADLFRANLSEGYLISADVYRRDEIDRSHYPIFHQMEGARSWDRTKVPNGDVAAAIWSDLEKLPKHDIEVEDFYPPFHYYWNPRQEAHHSAAEAEAIGAHLKRSLELMVVEIFTRAKAAAKRADPNFVDEPLQVRWVEAYFPFTSPSWELEVLYNGKWLECLGCGVVKQDIYINAGVPDQVGWAFGIGLERIAMLLFNIPDIRLFWSQDYRFIKQFQGVSDNLDLLRRFQPFSKYPGAERRVSFWLNATSAAQPTSEAEPASAADGNTDADAQQDLYENQVSLHDNEVMEIVRSVAGDIVEDVKLTDVFTHPKTLRVSRSYCINYRSLERTLPRAIVAKVHGEVQAELVGRLGVEIR